jgi:hypothetical protein
MRGVLIAALFCGAFLCVHCGEAASADRAPWPPTSSSWLNHDPWYLAHAQPPSESPSDQPPGMGAQPGRDTLLEEPPPTFRMGGCPPRPCPDEPKPWTLPQPCLLQKFGAKLGGWLDQGITFNAHNPPDGFNGPVGLNDLNSEWQVNQLWLFIDRPMQNDGCGWGLGGRIDLLYGTDWRFGINHGLEDRINAFNRQSYGLVIPQMYLEVGYNRLSFKLGHFASPLLVYETVPSILNPLYSHSYAIAFSEPNLVTGVLGEYKLNDRLALFAGFHRGWMMFEDNNHCLDVTGGFRWSSDDKRTSVIYAINSGPQDPAGARNRFSYVLLARHKFTDRFEYIIQHDYGQEDNAAPRNHDAEWYGLLQYFLYQLNPKLRAVARFEWFRDDDGVRVHGAPPAAGLRVWPAAPGFVGNFYELTLGLNWKPHPNLIVRPEVRWDWYDGTPNQQGLLPFDSGAKDQQFLFAVDMIVTF